ncbi:hypothetical protein JOC77_001132 [Peribacillus deserti]|uniref:Uncharacterized protein n=1 Tax=Peribacillus deserti TaxID=673318 RepID=A0ABS2QFB3_9BACI|nr:hypothetical protein [Peribacillus deserti]MBM7691725.1 hypothetical protein [Peribacillus deserti]
MYFLIILWNEKVYAPFKGSIHIIKNKDSLVQYGKVKEELKASSTGLFGKELQGAMAIITVGIKIDNLVSN